MDIRSPSILAFVGSGILLLAPHLLASEPVPGEQPNGQLISTQEKAADLFDQGDFDRALFIYEKELAPRGDKFAQYMVGYMYDSGHGVDVDVVEAAAWYSLAAERGERSFVKVRDEHWSSLDEAQQQNTRVRFAELRTILGDRAVVTRLVEEDLALLRSRNNSRPAMSVGFGQDRNGSLSEYQRASRRLVQRLAYLQHTLDHPVPASEEQRAALAALAAEAEFEIQRFAESLR